MSYFSGPLGTNRLFLCLWAGIAATFITPAWNGSGMSAALCGFAFAAFLADAATYLDNKALVAGQEQIAKMTPAERERVVTDYINRKYPKGN